MNENPIEFLDNITDEKIMELLCNGFKRDTEIEVRRKNDGPVDMVSTLMHIAARYNNVTAMQMLMQYGFDVNQLDEKKLLPIYYALNAYSPQSMIFLLCNKSQITNIIDLEQFENHDDVIERIQVLFSYCTKPTELYNILLQSNNTRIHEYLIKYDITNDLFLQTPNIYWNELKIDWIRLFSILDNTKCLLNEAMYKIINTDSEFKMHIDNLTHEINNAFQMLTKCRSLFRDFKKNAQNTIEFIDQSLCILSRGSDNDVYEIYDSTLLNPIVHSSIFASQNNETQKLLPILESLKESVICSINEIPDYEDVLNRTTQAIKDLKPTFENEIIPIIIKQSKENEQRQALSSLISCAHKILENNIIMQNSFDFDSSLIKLRTAANLIGWKLPQISGSYQYFIQVNNELKETNNAISEYSSFQTTCPSCHRNAVSRLCSNCNAMLACSHCSLPLFCPKCRKQVSSTDELKKTSFFGLIE